MECRERARLDILWYVTQFCLTHTHGDGKHFGSICGFDESHDAQPGDLIALKSAPRSEWYLSWLVEIDRRENGFFDRYLCESIETGRQCWWANAGVAFMERRVVAENPQWRWTDRQFAFRDKWHRVCYKERDAYIVLPTGPAFGEGRSVTLGTRIRFGLDDYRPTKTFDDWRKTTKAMMREFYDECVDTRKERPNASPDSAQTEKPAPSRR